MKNIKNNSVADQPYLDQISQTDIAPIFLMGDHRSGTTLLYKMLVETGCFNFVNAYHIIKYNEILSHYMKQTEGLAVRQLEQVFRELKISDRTIDKVMVTPALPEEYGFILKNIAGDNSCITPHNLPIFQQLCRKIQFISDPDKPLLLKNPWDFPQFMYVRTVIPRGKFIFIHRHPLHVINSKLKAIRLLLSDWNPYTALIARWYQQIFNNPLQRYLYRLLYSQFLDLGVRRVTQESYQSTTYFLQNIESLSDQDYYCVRYEDLCQSPEAIIAKILEFLNLQSKSTLNYKGLIEPRPVNLLPEVIKRHHRICQTLNPYLRYHNYPEKFNQNQKKPHA